MVSRSKQVPIDFPKSSEYYQAFKQESVKYVLAYGSLPQVVPGDYELSEFEVEIDFEEYKIAVRNQPDSERASRIVMSYWDKKDAQVLAAEQEKQALLEEKVALLEEFSLEDIQHLKTMLSSDNGEVQKESNL